MDTKTAKHTKSTLTHNNRKAHNCAHSWRTQRRTKGERKKTAHWVTPQRPGNQPTERVREKYHTWDMQTWVTLSKDRKHKTLIYSFIYKVTFKETKKSKSHILLVSYPWCRYRSNQLHRTCCHLFLRLKNKLKTDVIQHKSCLKHCINCDYERLKDDVMKEVVTCTSVRPLTSSPKSCSITCIKIINILLLNYININCNYIKVNILV